MLLCVLTVCALAQDVAAFSHPMHRGIQLPRVSSTMAALRPHAGRLARVGMPTAPRMEAVNTMQAASAVPDRTSSENDTVQVGKVPVAAEEGASSKEQFVFTKQWYPVAVVEFLDTRKPHPIQLMGKDLVAWLDVTTNQWNVFEDACPHRLAPLSEGRIEPDGTLLCTYHAWRFNAKGECTSIPQAKKEREAELCALPKACTIQHPVQEAQGLLWVWGEPGAPGSDAAIEASLKPPCLIPELEDAATKDRAKRLTWSIRDMPYGVCVRVSLYLPICFC